MARVRNPWAVVGQSRVYDFIAINISLALS